MRPLTYRLAASAVAAAAAVWGATLELATGNPGNLFTVGESVRIQVNPGPLEWRVTDVHGDEVQRGTAAQEGPAAIEIDGLRRGYYELTATAGARFGRLTFAVLSAAPAGDPPPGPLNVDGATAWLERNGRHEALAAMLRRVGIGWVRERFSWGATEPRKGTVRWEQYDAVADAFTAQGVRVYQIFHDSPSWSHGGRGRTRNPRDLRDVYHFARRLAEHYHKRVRA